MSYIRQKEPRIQSHRQHPKKSQCGKGQCGKGQCGKGQCGSMRAASNRCWISCNITPLMLSKESSNRGTLRMSSQNSSKTPNRLPEKSAPLSGQRNLNKRMRFQDEATSDNIHIMRGFSGQMVRNPDMNADIKYAS